MKNILFVCTGNSCRSVMAEGLLKKILSDRLDEFTVSSAGISAIDGSCATEEAIRVMKEAGVDVSRHRSRRLTRAMIESANFIFVMDGMHRAWVLGLCPEAEQKVMLLQDMGVPDPIGKSDEFYRQVFEMIQRNVVNIAESL